ncbi:MAG: ribosome small subunit-dependent GTPase A [Phycisphaerae bacterium]
MALRPNRQDRPRSKAWIRQYLQLDQADEAPLAERVRAKGDLSRKRTIIEPAPAAHPQPDQATGVVVAIRGPLVSVDDGQQVWSCTVRRMLRTRLIEQHNAIAVGDHVRFSRSARTQDSGLTGVIESVGPRRGVLTRRYGDRVHVVAANVDQVLIVSSVDLPPLKPHLIDRYLVAAHAGQLQPVICINKIDLDADGRVQPILQRYRRLGYTCLATSAVQRTGIDQLGRILAEHQSVIAGQSGVGKSSLLNALQPSLKLKVAPVSQATLKGRHTTALAELLRLDSGGYVVDTPGIRQLELADVSPGQLEAYFVEFVDRVRHCKYPNCTHIPEDGCAIKQAVEHGQIDRDRYDSYVRMFQQLQRAGQQASP